MIILIDAGNTRVKFGWLKPETGERESADAAVAHNDLAQLSGWIGQLGARPAAAFGVNVAAASIAHSIEDLLAPYCPVSWITSQSQAFGVRNAYKTASQLGADRWVAMVGMARHAQASSAMATAAGGARFMPPSEPTAAARYIHMARRPLLLASFGTATTIDTLGPDTTADGLMFHGGLIFPGPALMRSALAQNTANLPDANGDITAYPTDTHSAITSGIAAAQAGAVLRQWLLGLEHFNCPPRVYSSGGAWPVVRDETERLLGAVQARMDLPITPVTWLAAPVLDGLACIALELALH